MSFLSSKVWLSCVLYAVLRPRETIGHVRMAKTIQEVGRKASDQIISFCLRGMAVEIKSDIAGIFFNVNYILAQSLTKKEKVQPRGGRCLEPSIIKTGTSGIEENKLSRRDGHEIRTSNITVGEAGGCPK